MSKIQGRLIALFNSIVEHDFVHYKPNTAEAQTMSMEVQYGSQNKRA